MVEAYLIISLVCVLLWTPILIRFLRSWRSRRNPVSLAICGVIALVMWTSMAGMWLVTGKIQTPTLILSTTAMSAVTALFAHAAFFWSKRRFNDARGN